jgi:hypothetical protein
MAVNRRWSVLTLWVLASPVIYGATVEDAIRAARKTRGGLANDITTDRYVSLQFTHVQKTSPSHVSADQGKNSRSG